MAKGDTRGKRAGRERDHERLKATFEDFRRKGVYIKRVLRGRGYNFPFYDFYDSYADEFAAVAAQAKRDFPSLLGVFEVEDDEYYGVDRSRFAAGMQQIFWHTEAEEDGYGTAHDESNVNGFTNAFHSVEGQVRTLVVIRRVVPNSRPHREFKYVMKLIALLHELGHVHDMEREIHFDHAAKTFDVTEAEVFAHLYAFRRMAERNYYQCFTMLVEALRSALTRTDYLRDVARLTLERMPDYKLVDVNSIPLEPLTAADIQALGAEGRRAFGGAVR